MSSQFTNIFIIGGSYGGITALKTVRDLLKIKQSENKLNGDEKFRVTMIEPRDGFLNLIAIPRTLVDLSFGPTQYYKYTDIGGLGIHRVIDDQGNAKFTHNEEDKDDRFEITTIQGKVINVDENKATFKIGNQDEVRSINFDYVILASGRDRNYPVTPAATSKEAFLEEMKVFYDGISQEDVKTISIIGAGAVGIELAGEFKHFFPNKKVNLIHPHPTFPPEPLANELKQKTKESLQRANIDIHCNVRIEKELDNGDLITTTGDTIKSDINYWSTSKYNNIKIVQEDLRSQFVTPDSSLAVNDFLQLSNDEKTVENFFCIGDIADLPIIKTAGWAIFMAALVSKNIINKFFDEEMKEKFPPFDKLPVGMLLIAGNGDVISSNNDAVELNNPEYVEAYKDYRFSSSFKFLKLDLPTGN